MYNSGLLRCRSSKITVCYTDHEKSMPYVLGSYNGPTKSHGSIPAECNMLIWEMTKYSSGLKSSSFRKVFEDYLAGNPSVLDLGTLTISPVGVNIWSQAWVPLILDCQMTYYPDPENWEFGEVDFSRSPGAPTYNNIQSVPITFERRIPLTRGPGQIISDQISRFRAEEEEMDDGGVIDSDLEEKLDALETIFKNRDLLLPH